MTKKQITDFIEWLSNESPESVLIGNPGEDRDRFIPAVVGFDSNTGSVIYSRDKLIKCYMKTDKMSYEDAVEWIGYNVERALPYYRPHAPIIMDDVKMIMGW